MDGGLLSSFSTWQPAAGDEVPGLIKSTVDSVSLKSRCQSGTALTTEYHAPMLTMLSSYKEVNEDR